MKRARSIGVRQLEAAADALEESARRIRIMVASIERGEWDALILEVAQAARAYRGTTPKRPKRAHVKSRT